MNEAVKECGGLGNGEAIRCRPRRELEAEPNGGDTGHQAGLP